MMDNNGNGTEVRRQDPVILKKTETVLSALLIGTAFLHIWTEALQYVFNIKKIERIEFAAAVSIAAIVIFYGIVSAIHYPGNLKKVRACFVRMRSYEQVFLMFFAVWFVVSCLVNRKLSGDDFYLKMNLWQIFDAFVNAFVLFPLAKVLPKNKSRQIIECGMLIVLISYSLFSVYALWHFFHRNFIVLPSGRTLSIYEEFIAVQFGCHYNLTGAYSFVMLGICLYFVMDPHRWIRVISFLFLPIHLLVCHLSNSRTIFAAGLITVSLFMFFYMWNRFSSRDLRFRLLTALFASAAVFCFYLYSRPLAFALFEEQSQYSETVPAAVDDDPGTSVPTVRSMNSFNGRELIWRSSLKSMMKSPSAFFFGVTEAGVRNALIDAQIPGPDYDGYVLEAMHAHNIILQVGVSLGVPAMIAYIFFLIRIGLQCLRFLFSQRRTSFRSAFVIPLMILGLMLTGTMENYIVRYSLMAGVFILLSGCLSELTSPCVKTD